jgi:predicted ATPase/DNA-binding SARP family transcriptional activator
VVVVGVLGPLALHAADGSPVRIGGARRRRLLCALALHAGAPVDVDLLAELVWGDDLPADPDGAVQTNVARLRRLLPPAVTVGTGPRAYRLEVDPHDLDSARFAAHLAQASGGEPERRLAELDAALELWRGRPFAELDHPAVEPEVARLSGLRTAAVEQQAQALLDLGRAGQAAAACAALVAAEPLREGAVALLMRALVAAGRPGEAVAAFARLRAELAGELGLDPSPQLRRLHEQVLRQEVPPPPAPARAPSARPRPALPVSSFVGREADLATVAAMLAERRIVTLCGPGGVGKSRLARHAAAAVADRYDDGVLAVDLADTRPDAVEATVAAALRLTEAGPGGLGARIVEVLAVRRQLLLLDDCEHVADAVAALVEAVACGAPGVDVLVTSREALRADGEQVVRVAPLPPGPAALLLADRVRAVDPTAAWGDRELLADICARLDGLPLALELAAARVPAVGLPGLLGALAEPLDALGRGRRTAAPRHRSLRDVVQWSYGLLDDAQRALFVKLSVFAGAVEPAAVAAVCGDAGALPDLVDRSLVVRRDGDPVTFGMLETLRAFGRAQAATDPATAALRARHAAWAVDLALDVAAARCRPDEAAAVRRFDAHLPDLRRAHAHLCAAGPVPDLLRLGLVFAELGYQRARVDLVRMADEALLAVGCDPAGGGRDGGADDTGTAAHPLVPRLLGLTATPAWQRGDLDGAERRARRALALAERLGDPLAARDAVEALSNVDLFRGDLAAARAGATRVVELSVAAGDRPLELVARTDLVFMAAYAGDAAGAVDYERAARRLAAEMGSPVARGWAAYAAGERRAEAGDPAAAGFLEEAVRLAEEADAAFLAGVARHTLLTTAARTDDPADALSRFGPLLDTWHALGAWTQLWIAVRALVEALSRRGQHRDVAVLLGALRASPRASPEYGADSGRVRSVERLARSALGDEFDALLAEGAALGDGGAVALARRLTRAPGVR